MKKFTGKMKITPRGMIVPSFILEDEWKYNPEKKVWVASNTGTEYDENICTIL